MIVGMVEGGVQCVSAQDSAGLPLLCPSDVHFTLQMSSA
jgi:hypothetical protein